MAVGLLAGNIRQGRIGVGYASAFGVAVAPVAEPVLTLMQVDEVFDEIPTVIGAVRKIGALDSGGPVRQIHRGRTGLLASHPHR